MSLELVTIPCLSDNYAFLIRDEASGEVAIVDVPEAGPIIAALEERDWTLNHILITHHHDDHIAGVPELVSRYGARVVGGKPDAHRLPPLDLAVEEGDQFSVGETVFDVMDVSGHTIGHVAFYAASANMAFTADSLMALGCGRLFEGTHDQAWETLVKLAKLPEDTIICSGHEYTAANAKFAITIEPDNDDLHKRIAEISEKRAKGLPTVPSRLSLELKTNPFIRADKPEVKAALGMTDAHDGAVFAEIRTRKDNF